MSLIPCHTLEKNSFIPFHTVSVISFMPSHRLEKNSFISSQCSFTRTTAVPTAATIPATTAATNAGAPRITAPTAAKAVPTTISISLSQLNPSFSMEKKFTMPNNAPPITLAIPATVVPTTPNTATKASCNVPAPPAASAKALANLEINPVSAISPPPARIFMLLNTSGTPTTSLVNAEPIQDITPWARMAFLIFLIDTAPITMAIVPISIFSKNSIILS